MPFLLVLNASVSSLRVKIYDTANQQFTIPESVIQRPAAPTESCTGSSDLVFNYDASPFAFWITRRSDPDAMPIFDTRTASLPPTPIPPFNSSDIRTAFDGFPLVFEDQYLQVRNSHAQGNLQVAIWRLDYIGIAVWYKHLWSGRGDCEQRIPTRYRYGWGCRYYPNPLGSRRWRSH